MQAQAMNNYGNRGFGGQPQPQRQGGRRGNNNRGFRNSRFDSPANHRNQNQGGQGGQRPNEQAKVIVIDDNKSPPPQVQTPQPQQNTPQQQNKPQQQQNKPQQQQNKPQQQQQNKPQQQQQNKPPQQQQQNKPPQQQQQNKPIQQQNLPIQQQQQKSQQQNNLNTVSKPDLNEKPLAKNEPKQAQKESPIQQNGTNFGGNKPGGNWVGNKSSGGGFNQGGGGGRDFNHGGAGGGRDFNQGGGGGRDYNQGGGGNFNQGGNSGPGNRQFGQKSSGPGSVRSQRNNQRGPPQGGDGLKPGQREEQMLANKLKDIMGPLLDLPPLDQSEVKFSGRSRLYIGNLTGDVTEEEILALFSTYGEPAELFVNKEKNFGFIKLDYRVNAEKAKRELDGKMRNGRPLRVRFAPHNSAVRVKNLPPFVSNELLFKAFEIFGKIERAYVKVDERGKTLGEGVVEYARKPSALAAIRNCTEKCYFLTSSLRPVIVDSYEEPDEFDGYQEKNLPKKHPDFLQAREHGPRFSEAGSFEHEYGTRWKQLHEMHRQKEEALKAELASEEGKLEAQMEYAKYEHETELLREQLRQREQDRERQKRSWELAERAADERREADRVTHTRHGEELAQRMRLQDDELRRRQQENTLFVQAQRLNSMLDRQEQDIFDSHSQQQPLDGGFRDQYDMGRGYDDMMQPKLGWEGPRQVDDFPNKRRRF